MPNIVFVVFLTALFNFFFLLPEAQLRFFKFATMTLAGLGNFAAAGLENGYFSPSIEREQLLHTWSLGVEEQFYLLLPLIFFVLWRTIKNIRLRGYVLFTILMLSFIMSALTHQNDDPKWAYYSIVTRFFELFCGVFLAFFLNHYPFKGSPRIANFIGSLSLILLISFTFIFSAESIWPGVNAFSVCLLTSMILYFGAGDIHAFGFKSVLSNSIMLFCGKISFSLYLWHWIFTSTLTELGYSLNDMSSAVKLFIGIVVLVISYFSWKFVENTFRYSSMKSLPLAIVFWIIIPFSWMMGVSSIAQKYPLLLFKDEERRIDTYAYNDVPVVKLKPSDKEIHKKYQRYEYLIGDIKSKKEPEVLILANSHFHPFKKFMASELSEVQMIGHVLHEKIKSVFNEKGSEELYMRLLKGKKFLVIWARLTNHTLGTSQLHWYDWFLKKAIELNIKPIFYVPGLELKSDEFARRLIYSSKIRAKKIDFELSFDESRNLIARDLFNKAYQQYGPHVLWVDFKEFLCRDRKCSFHSNGEPLLFDRSHITLKAGEDLGLRYQTKYPNIFLDVPSHQKTQVFSLSGR